MSVKKPIELNKTEELKKTNGKKSEENNKLVETK
jgi:hypothetical protein